MTENWLSIPGYEGRYCVSDQGNVMHMDFKKTGLPGIPEVIAIRKRSASGESQLSLSKAFGVSPSTISKVVSGSRWGHIPFAGEGRVIQ